MNQKDKNFINNQNYIFSQVDKKYLIYNFYEKKESYIGTIITIIIFFILFLIGVIFTAFGISLDYLIYPFLFFLFIVFIIAILIGIYLLLFVFFNSYMMKINKKITFIFRGKPKGLLLKKHPIGKYKEVYYYLVTMSEDNYEYNRIYNKKQIKKEMDNDFIYIKK